MNIFKFGINIIQYFIDKIKNNIIFASFLIHNS